MQTERPPSLQTGRIKLELWRDTCQVASGKTLNLSDLHFLIHEMGCSCLPCRATASESRQHGQHRAGYPVGTCPFIRGHQVPMTGLAQKRAARGPQATPVQFRPGGAEAGPEDRSSLPPSRHSPHSSQRDSGFSRSFPTTQLLRSAPRIWLRMTCGKFLTERSAWPRWGT